MSAGREAIERRLSAVYPEVRQAHSDVALPMRAGGARPLERITALSVGEPAHWLYVSQGLSELHEKKSKRADRSGWGLELTFRLKRGKQPKAPDWPFALLQGLAAFVFQHRSPFAAGGQMDLNGPVRADAATAQSAVVFREDSKLGKIETPFGAVQFLQVVPVHAAELAACEAWSSAGVLGVLARRDPELVTDLARPSLFKDPALAAEVEQGIAREGSSLGTVVMDSLEWSREGDGVVLRVGAHAAESLAGMLAGRTLHGRRVVIEGAAGMAIVDAGPAPAWRVEDRALVLTLSEAAARAVQARLLPRRGAHTFPELAGFRLEIMPSEIRDPEGKVLRTVG